MTSWIALTCLITATGLLLALSVIDLKTRLLPNKLVAPFAATALLFHFSTSWHYMSLSGALLGALIGFCSLYFIRMIANRIYQTDTLGLGDIKLMSAGGLWLGPDMLMMALTIGATASLLHGLGYAIYKAGSNKEKINLSRLQIPAGPGLALGLAITALWQLRDFPVNNFPLF